MRLPIASGAATGAVAIALYPLFQSGGWFWTSLGVILVVTGISVLGSRYTLPNWLVPPAQLLAVLIYLTAVFTGSKAWAVVVPTRDSVLGLAKLLATGFADIQRFAAPVPPNSGITLLTCGGVGLVAILVDLLASRLRRAALTGLPLLALFTVPAAVVSEPINWLAFIIAALGYLGLLAADGRERVNHWGRAVLVRRAPSFIAPKAAPDTGTLRLSGKRIGVTAIALAILLPALLPTLEPDPLFGFGVGNGKGGGGNSISIANPIVSLRGQLSLPNNSTVLTYTSSDGSPRYLRLHSLDVFDGEQWTMTAPQGHPEDRISDKPMPPAPGQSTSVPTTRATIRIAVSDQVKKVEFLPLPYPAGKVTIEGDWRPDRDTLMVFSTRDTAEGQAYEVVTNEPKPTAEMLKASAPAPSQISERYLQLPEGLPREIRELAAQVTKRDSSRYEQAVQLQEFFTKKGGFTYSLSTQGHGEAALTDFLIRGRTGFCEQFAASMAVLARVLGIPARVAIGYTGGSNFSGAWQVRTHDSHAWPELYFEGVGWLRFEPTPAGTGGQGSATVPSYTRPEIVTTGGDEPAVKPTGGSTGADGPTGSAGNRRDQMLDRDFGGPAIAVDEGMPLAAQIGIGVVVAALIALIPAMLRWELRARRRRSYSREKRASGDPSHEDTSGSTGVVAVRTDRRESAVTAAWAELDDALCDYGMSRRPSESPRALARRLIEQYAFEAEASAAVTRIATAVERMLFARTPAEIGPLPEDLRSVRRALAVTVTRGRRIRAVLLPPSTLLRARRLGERALDGFDRLENLRLRRPARKNA
ncbi:transglutaminase TgpA family protein [Streptosporangium sp. CA-135522]|uniref:transglutaminase TgpA family protein n=1 Tax=Streptosporangium sp. CA-135522 TaxID=3240072 RepID=UPI003D8EB754